MIEHCMQWGGEQRLRIKITLDTAGAFQLGARVEILGQRWASVAGAGLLISPYCRYSPAARLPLLPLTSRAPCPPTHAPRRRRRH